MLSQIKIIVTALILSIGLGACGFSPMYGGTTTGSYGQVANEDILGQVFIANIPNAEGQYLRNALIDNFNPGGVPISPKYRLLVGRLNENKVDLDITVESETTRAQLQISTNMTLKDAATGKVLLKRSLYGSNSYNVLGSQFTTLVSKDDARDAILDDLARQAQTAVSLYFRRSETN